jgi:hypothetical protein
VQLPYQRAARFVLVLAAAGLAACSDGPSPLETELGEIGPNRQVSGVSAPLTGRIEVRPAEAEAVELAMRIPSLGGFFVDQNGTMVAFLTDLSQETAARVALEAVLERRRAEDPRRRSTGASLAFRQGEYGFLQLAEWRDRVALPMLDISGVTLVDLDEERNRVTVGIEEAAIRDQVVQKLAELNVPAAAVLTDVTGRITPTQTLSAEQRPLQGGFRIVNSNGGGCTLGFNIMLNGYRVFLTNSHCTIKSWDLDNGRFYQPFLDPFYDVGYEYKDPRGESCGFLSKNVCRYADVAAILVNSGTAVDLGYIGRTTYSAYGNGGVGSTEIDTLNPRFFFNSTDVYPELNERVHKVGASTGWTEGDVTRTCVDTSVPYRSNSRLRCQYTANYGSMDGDSGSPVFKLAGGNGITLQGIHWGRVDAAGDAVFSPWGGVQKDMPGFGQLFP